MAEQFGSGFFANAGNVGQATFGEVLRAFIPVEGNRKTVRFVPRMLNYLKAFRFFIDE